MKPDECVATLLERSVNLVVAQLAILKAGGVYVPIDTQAPAARQAWLVSDCNARLVITEQTLGEIPAETSVCNPEVKRSSRDAAYVMYTSGSTGTPKGVVVAHHSVNRLVLNNGTWTSRRRTGWRGWTTRPSTRALWKCSRRS